MTFARKQLGAGSEERASRLLEEKGMKILARNFRCALGEIDLVAQDGPTLVFVEVKSRRSLDFGPASLAVNWRKQKKITQLAQLYLKQRKLFNIPCRFDVVSIHYPEQGKPLLDHIPNAFSVRR